MTYKPARSKLFGAALKHLLHQRNLSQRKFAEKANLETDYVSKLVNGKVSEPRQEQRRKIAKGLGVTEQELQKLIAQYSEEYGQSDGGGSTSDSEAIAPSSTTTDNSSATSTPLKKEGKGGATSPANSRHIYHNLTSPSYTAFIGRKDELNRLLKFLSPDNPNNIITVYGIGGVGKTALIYSAACLCREASNGVVTVPGIPTFDAIIFTSAKNSRLTSDGMLAVQRRQRNLSDMFREIAITLDQPAITQAAPNDQLDRVRESLRNQRTLLIVDNMETIEETDNILDFLIDLPLGVKAVITTRDRRKHHHIRLECLPEDDGIELIKHQASETGITLTEEQCKDIYKATQGIPVAIVYASGQVASGYSMETVLKRIASADCDVAHFLFKDCVQEMKGKPEHKLLISLAIFPDAPIREAVAEVAGLIADRIDSEDGLVRLQDLCLVKQKNGRYSMLSLTREYALLELAAYPEFEKEARLRWLNWYLDFARKYGGEEWENWHINYDRLQEERENLLAVLYWCAAEERYEDIRNLWQFLSQYTHIYGYWVDRIFWLTWLINNSMRCGELATAVKAMSSKAWTLTLMYQLEEAEKLLGEAWNRHDYADLDTQSRLADYFAQFHIGKKQYKEARLWLTREEEIINKASFEEREHIRHLITVAYYRAEIAYLEEKYQEAKQLYQQVDEKGNKIGWQRAIIYAQNGLANISIKEGDLKRAEKLLNTGLTVAERNNDKRLFGIYQRSFARLEEKRGNLDKVRARATKALDGFRRLGMTRDAEEMQSLLDSLG